MKLPLFVVVWLAFHPTVLQASSFEAEDFTYYRLATENFILEKIGDQFILTTHEVILSAKAISRRVLSPYYGDPQNLVVTPDMSLLDVVYTIELLAPLTDVDPPEAWGYLQDELPDLSVFSIRSIACKRPYRAFESTCGDVTQSRSRVLEAKT